MRKLHFTSLFVVLSCLVGGLDASPGDVDPVYRSCLGQCQKTGCVKDRCFPNCEFSSDGFSTNGSWYTQEPLYLLWKQWDCLGDCRYYCMRHREEEREALDEGPVKYHGKWPFIRVYGVQEPASVAFSALNLAMHFHGWLSFLILLRYKLPLKLNKKAYYEYATLFHFYALLSMNSWFWSAIFHSRDVGLTEKLDYSSAVALLGYSLLLSMLRSFNVGGEASRVMFAAPLIAFDVTHILFINLYKLDYGIISILQILSCKICVVMVVSQLLIWSIWAGVSQHPYRWKLRTVVVGGGFAMLA